MLEMVIGAISIECPAITQSKAIGARPHLTEGPSATILRQCLHLRQARTLPCSTSATNKSLKLVSKGPT